MTPEPIPSPEPSLDENEPFLMVYVGPVPNRNQAAEIAAQLTIAGYAARVSQREEAERFLVVSDALPIEEAERRRDDLAQAGIRAVVRPMANGNARLDFGTFANRDAAEVLAARVRAQGVAARVVAEGGVTYIVALGPYRESVAKRIVALVRSTFGWKIPVGLSRA